jgi:hypothetical protein
MGDQWDVHRNWEAYKTARWAQGAAAIDYMEALRGDESELAELMDVYLKRRRESSIAWNAWKASRTAPSG